MASLSLAQLLDLAIGTPEVGAVNFQALHSLLRALLRHLGLQDLPARLPGHGPTAGGTHGTSVAAGVGQRQKMEVLESGVTQDILQEFSGMEVAQAHVAEEIPTIQEAFGLEGSGGHAVPTEPTTANVDTQCEATTPGMHPGSPGTQTITHGPQPGSPSIKTTTLGTQPVSPGTQATVSGIQPGTATSTQATIPGMQALSPGTQATIPGTQPGTSSTQVTIPGTQPGTPSSQAIMPVTQPKSSSLKTTAPGMQPGTPSTQSTVPGMQPAPPGTPGEGAGVQPRPAPLPMEPCLPEQVSTEAISCALGTQESLDQVRQLGHLYPALKEQVAQLEATKADWAELEKLRLLFSERDQESLPSVLANVQGCVSSLQGLARELQGQQEKIRQLEEAFGKLEEAFGKLEAAGAEQRADGGSQISLQLGSKVQELKQELGEQQDMSKAMLEQLVAEKAEQLQGQLDTLRVMVESMGQEQAEAQVAWPVHSGDTNVQLGQLLQRHEELQEQVTSLRLQKEVGKVARQLPGRSQQDEEFLKNIQATFVQVQRDCEELSSAMGSLLDEHQQRQKDHEALFLRVERLEEDKVDKEDLALRIDVKADRAALAGKVSRRQLEATMERLEERIQEVQSRVMDQEQVQRQLQEQVDSKLGRLELEPFLQQLEQQWGSSLEQLKERALPAEPDGAAGMKRQLLPGFCCLSCDRTLGVRVPGPHVVTVPSLPPLSPRLAWCPQSHPKLEPAQQQEHREQVAERRYPRVPRPCGGQHTLTRPQQQPPRLRTITPWLLQPPSKGELELLGWDGHTDRWDRQLPPLLIKQGFPRDQPKVSLRQKDTGSASAHGHLSPARGLLRPPGDGSSPLAAGGDGGSPTEPSPPQQP